MLTSEQLACPPVVRVPEPMVAVATGQTASLACLVNENASHQQLYWLDFRGELIVNNSGSNSFITQDGKNQGGQRYTINTGPVFIDPYSYERERKVTSYQGNAGDIDGAEILASSSSSIIITAALSYRKQSYGEGIGGERQEDKTLRNYAFNEESGLRADENPDTRDPFLVNI